MRRQSKVRQNEPRRSRRRSKKAGAMPELKGWSVTHVFSGEVKRREFSKKIKSPESPLIKALESCLVPDDHLLQRYHLLVDKRLNETLHPQETRELHRIEAELQLFEDAETAETEGGVEDRHRILMQQLSELTAELRRFNAGEQSKPEIP